MNVKDARKITVDACSNEIQAIVDQIQKACEKGESHITLTGMLEGGVKIYLKDMGYDIEEKKGNNFIITYVDWSN